MSMKALHQEFGAELAGDNIPLHYGNLQAEYQAGLESAILLDRSHEGRIKLIGTDRFELLNRMSTNDTLNLKEHDGCATIFTNHNGRIIDRVSVFAYPNDEALIVTEPGRGEVVRSYLQRNIFFNDKVKLQDITSTTHQFGLHGAKAEAIMQAIIDASQTPHVNLNDIPLYGWRSIAIDNTTFRIHRRKPLIGAHWSIVVEASQAMDVYRILNNIGQKQGLRPAGSLTYNTLRIRAGRVAGRELSQDYIPLEVGLWDEVSFKKGCYTGQEIIARMESRQRLAKTLVALSLTTFQDAPATLYNQDGQTIGTLTSSVKAPDGSMFAMGTLKTDYIHRGQELFVGEAKHVATVAELIGAQPPFLEA
jgi:folate-binding protein YgfZ